MHSAALPALAPTPRLHIHLCIAIASLPATPELLPACDGSRTTRFSPCSPRKGSHRVSDRPNPLQSRPESVFPIPSFLYFSFLHRSPETRHNPYSRVLAGQDLSMRWAPGLGRIRKSPCNHRTGGGINSMV